MTGRATIDGEPILADSDVRWRLREGVTPTREVFSVTPTARDRLLDGRLRPVELRIEGESSLVVSDLYVIGEAPSDNPKIARVEVVDRRYFWSRPLVERGYNITRNVGPQRLKNPGTIELQPVVDDVWYAPWSTRDEQGREPWKASEILRDVLDEVLRSEREYLKAGVNVDVGDLFDELPVENLELSDSGDQAIRRVLTYLPEAAITVDPDGTVRIYSRVSGRQSAQVAAAGPESRDGGHVQYMTNDRVRPLEVHVYFGRICELRFDFEEREGRTLSIDDRFVDNVLPVPDFELEVDGETVAQSTWIRFDQAFEAWEDAPGIGQLTFDLVQKAMVPFMDLWSGILLAGARQPDADWMARVQAVIAHYRQSFRISRRWMDRILSLEAYRVAVIDPETGQRAPAVAYSDFARIPSQRGLIAQAAAGVDLAWAMNVDGYPDDSGGWITEDWKPAPAEVSIADEDQGILHLTFKGDPFGLTQVVLPSRVVLEGDESFPGPTKDLTDRSRPITFDTLSRSGVPKLSAGDKTAIIVSAVPGSPNDERRLHRVVVTPGEVEGLLPDAMKAGLAQAHGPVVEVRVPTTIAAARVAWVDSAASEIEKAFGVLPGEPQLDELTINRTSNTGGASLQAVAEAIAARVYAMYADRDVGRKTVPLQPAIVPDGWLAEVVHSVTKRGHVTTELVLKDVVPEMNLFSLMDSGTRRQILKTARPGK